MHTKCMLLFIDISPVSSVGTSGVIEICYDGVWKTVCEPFSNVSAAIVCKELGFYDRPVNIDIEKGVNFTAGNAQLGCYDMHSHLQKLWTLKASIH